jgi:regulatory protein
MGVITALEPQKRKRDRVNVFVDGEFIIGLSLEVALKNKLQVGRKISARELERLIQGNELDQILAKVYRFLSYRPRSEKEILDYLARNEIGPLSTDVVIETLKRQKYLDDEEFARWWVEQRTKFRPRGKRILRAELFKKGISEEVIEETLASQLPDSEVKELVLKAAQKKQLHYRGLDQQEFRRKTTAFLARRGFDWETIKEVLDELPT